MCPRWRNRPHLTSPPGPLSWGRGGRGRPVARVSPERGEKWMMRHRMTNEKGQRRMARAWLGASAMLGATVVVSGCHVDMWEQPKIKAYYPSEFYADQQGSRPLVPGTVPQG